MAIHQTRVEPERLQSILKGELSFLVFKPRLSDPLLNIGDFIYISDTNGMKYVRRCGEFVMLSSGIKKGYYVCSLLELSKWEYESLIDEIGSKWIGSE